MLRNAATVTKITLRTRPAVSSSNGSVPAVVFVVLEHCIPKFLIGKEAIPSWPQPAVAIGAEWTRSNRTQVRRCRVLARRQPEHVVDDRRRIQLRYPLIAQVRIVEPYRSEKLVPHILHPPQFPIINANSLILFVAVKHHRHCLDVRLQKEQQTILEFMSDS